MNTPNLPTEGAKVKCPKCGSQNLSGEIACYRMFRWGSADGWCIDHTDDEDDTGKVICNECGEEWTVAANVLYGGEA